MHHTALGRQTNSALIGMTVRLALWLIAEVQRLLEQLP
jgi:hypothetical protein